MQRKIVYFINPISGGKTKEAALKKIVEKTTLQQIPFEILPTNVTGDYSFLNEKITNEKITDIVICGGDGTVNSIVKTLINTDINIGIIPMGSGNGLAFAAQIPKQTDKALDIIFKGKAAYIDSFLINEEFGCMLCGIGLDASVAHAFAKQPQRGLITYIQLSLYQFFRARPYFFELFLNGRIFTTEAYFISIANANQFGNHFTIAPKASLNDGLMDIVIVKKMSKWKMVWLLVKQIRYGQLNRYSDMSLHKSNILYFQTDKISIHNCSNALLHIDGDPAPSVKKLTISIIINAFRLIQP
ncbi:MAG: YegS/Rv2252/BmrU family lipid kinase [Sphingobacteriales bacterium]|nr:YegS/Rv2252/BmrU family lipid kinase [Sphingobacteriales bacterium]